MKSLLQSSVLLFFLGLGCTPLPTRCIRIDSGKIIKPIFENNFNSFLFKTNIRVYGKEFSGLLLTKQIQPKTYRVIFTTELGMKLFDFEFTDTAFVLHYCVPQFNRPALLNTLRKDIDILLMNFPEDKKAFYYRDTKNMYLVQRMDFGKFTNYYLQDLKTENLVQIIHSKKRIKKIIFTLTKYQDGLPTNILIKHCDIRLKIELNLLKK